MDDVWPWLASMPRTPADAPPPWSLPLAATPDGAGIVLQADLVPSSGANGGDGDHTNVAFSLAINAGANGVAPRTLWTSEGLEASPVALRVRLLVQLLDEVIALSPSVPCLSANALNLADASSEAKLDAEVVSGVAGVAGISDVSGPAPAAFFSLALLLRLFWCCALDAPPDSRFLFFRVLGAEIERTLGECRPALSVFLRSVGPDVEERFVRSLGYMLAKWCLLQEIQAGSSSAPIVPAACVSYATEVHGLWILKGYAPVLAMSQVTGAASSVAALPHELPEEPALRYGLVHTQLEAVVQLEYAVRVRDRRFVTVSVRVDNVRVRVARLGYADEDEDSDETVMDSERHFPSRIRVWVGPRYGASYATGPSLGRSTRNPERDVELTRTVKGAFPGATKLPNGGNGGFAPRMKAKMRSSARTSNRSWRWEQEADGSAGVFEGVLCDPVTGTEVSAWHPPGFGSRGGTGAADPRNGMRRRYCGPGRAFSKMRGLVVAGDELPEEVTWRVGREAEGRTLRWRLGLKAWVSYLPNEVRSRHFETRCIEWAHEVDLPLVVVHDDHS